jgi:hypothetical protein
MDHGGFDTLTRSMAGGTGSRRAVVRLVAACALTGLVTRLALGEDAAAKKHGRRQPRHGELHEEGRHRKKKHHRKARNRQEPQACGEDERRCNDGTCVSQGQCCPNERHCGDGSCIASDQCCPDASPPACGKCEAAVCEDGELVCRSTCEEGVICCHGHCTGRCTGGMAIDPATCSCECPSGTELIADYMTCCPVELACNHNVGVFPTTCCPGDQICVLDQSCS